MILTCIFVHISSGDSNIHIQPNDFKRMHEFTMSLPLETLNPHLNRYPQATAISDLTAVKECMSDPTATACTATYGSR